MEVENKDDQGYHYVYYTNRVDPLKKTGILETSGFPDQVLVQSRQARAITWNLRYSTIGRPQLVGSSSVEHSEIMSDRLNADH